MSKKLNEKKSGNKDDEEKKPHPNEKFTDKELEEALMLANGQPTKAAVLLDVAYPTVYMRIKANPKLKAVQSSYRARTHQDATNLAVQIAFMGTIKEPKVDKETKELIRGADGKPEMIDVKVDYGTRIGVITRLMEMYKGEDGVVENLNLLMGGESIKVEDWIKKMDEERNNPK